MRAIIRGLIRFIKAIFRLGFTLILIGICLFIDARYIEPKVLTVKDLVVTTPKWTGKKPIRMVLFNDVHLGENYSLQDFEKVVRKINSLSPELIIFAGDLIDDNKTYTDEEGAAIVMAQLKAPYGKFAVYGNHDHGGNGTRRYARIMEAAGFTLLRNSSQTVTLKTGGTIRIIGIDDVILSKPDFEKPFEKLQEGDFNLFVSHAPDVTGKVAGRPIDLQLSGHSHGGQVRLPIIGAPFTVPYGAQYIKGFYENTENPGMKLYVNPGIGTSQLPYRFLNPPEITVITLSDS